MAFAIANLSLVSAGDPATPRLWTYLSTTTKATTEAADYFAGSPMRHGDFLLVHASNLEALYSVDAVAAATSSITEIGTGGSAGQVWIKIVGTGYGSAGTVGYGLAPITGDMKVLRHVTTTGTTAVTGAVVLTLKVAGGTATTGVTLSAGNAAGDVDNNASLATNVACTAGDLIELISGGQGDAGAGIAYVMIEPT